MLARFAACAGVLLTACAPAPHSLVTIRDPLDLAGAAAQIWIGRELSLSAATKMPGIGFPFVVTVTQERPGRGVDLWLEVLDGGATAIVTSLDLAAPITGMAIEADRTLLVGAGSNLYRVREVSGQLYVTKRHMLDSPLIGSPMLTNPLPITYLIHAWTEGGKLYLFRGSSGPPTAAWW